MSTGFSYATRAADGPARDPRWHALSLVQTARESFGLRARDIAVLRGLLSLVSAESWAAGERISVYASNKTLSERCDGIEERTLRRRLQHLCALGLITRQLSPNRKRYTLRDASGAILISYGFDLAPLRAALPELEARAEEALTTAAELKTLRGLLRDRLWRLTEAGEAFEPALAGLLRNKTTPAELRHALETLPPLPEVQPQILPQTVNLSDSDSQTVRDIQSSYKEYSDREDTEITLTNALDQAPLARDYAPEAIESWHQLAGFTRIMAQALGIHTEQIQRSDQLLGQKKSSLVILGLLQAGTRVRHPAGYFTRLLAKAEQKQLNIARMFSSLTRNTPPRRPDMAEAW